MKISVYVKKQIMLGGDILLILAAFYFAPFFCYKVPPDLSVFFGLSEFIVLVVYLLVLYIFDFYNLEESIKNLNQIMKLLLVIFIVNIINASLFYLLHIRPYNSWVLFINNLITAALLFAWRFILIDLNGVAIKPSTVVILGSGSSGRALCKLLNENANYRVVGFIIDEQRPMEPLINGVPVLGGSRELMRCVEKNNVGIIVVCIDDEVSKDVYPHLVKATFSGVSVYEMPTFYEKVTGKIPVMHIDNAWLSYAKIHGVKKNIYNEKFKKIVDKSLACAGLIIAMPLMVLTAILIKIDSKGPVIYRQSRVGFNEDIFTLLKFRSMFINSESNGAVWAEKNDPRITRIGKLIRFLRVDELPQIWNVLKGEMSFIGPRPERPEFVKQLEDAMPYYMLRHTVKPGISGWAQVNYDYGASIEDAREKLQFDLYYIKNMTLSLDLYILLRTIRVVIFGKGSR